MEGRLDEMECRIGPIIGTAISLGAGKENKALLDDGYTLSWRI